MPFFTKNGGRRSRNNSTSSSGNGDVNGGSGNYYSNPNHKNGFTFCWLSKLKSKGIKNTEKDRFFLFCLEWVVLNFGLYLIYIDRKLITWQIHKSLIAWILWNQVTPKLVSISSKYRREHKFIKLHKLTNFITTSSSTSLLGNGAEGIKSNEPLYHQQVESQAILRRGDGWGCRCEGGDVTDNLTDIVTLNLNEKWICLSSFALMNKRERYLTHRWLEYIPVILPGNLPAILPDFCLFHSKMIK